MPTSANERFERLFANNPRPTKPLKAPFDDSKKQDNPDRETTDIASFESAETIERVVPTDSVTVPVQSSTQAEYEDTDDEDEYVALFSNKSRMTKKQKKSSLEGRHDAIEHSERTFIESRHKMETVSAKSSMAIAGASINHEDQEDNASAHSEGEPSFFGRFCPLRLVSVFPYKYMKDPDDRVSKHFFAANKFYDRKWSLYYLHPPQSFGKSPILLLPVSEVQALIDEISLTFEIALGLPKMPFTLDFYRDGTPLPQFLGHSKSRDDVTTLTKKIPDSPLGHGDCPTSAPEKVRSAYKTFHERTTDILLASKKGGSASKHKARNLLQTFEDSRNQLKRLQKCFGLRPDISAINFPSDISNDKAQGHKNLQQMFGCMLVKFLNVDEPSQYPFDHDPVIISIDVESYERNHNLITEIGISTLDTLDLVNVPPKTAGSDWIKHIRSRHFRIRGREYLVNKDFCVGNPEAFQFGQSEFIRLDAVADAIDSCFQWPFSVEYKQAGPHPPSFYDNSTTSTSDSQSTPPPNQSQLGSHTRNIILLGHNTTADISYLQSLNVQSLHPTSPNPVLNTFDTATLYQTLTSSHQPRSLGYISANLGIDAWFTHNAGNDARYTLEALVKIAIQSRLNEDEAQRLKDPESRGVIVDQVEVESMRASDEKLEAARHRAIKDAAEDEERKKREKVEEEMLAERVREWQVGDDGGKGRDVRW